MLYRKELSNIKVLPEKDGLQNIIKKVEWNIIFEDENTGVTSMASIHTILPDPSSDNFSTIDQVTPDQVLDWATTQQGGSVFIEKLKSFHEDELIYKNQLIGVVEYDINNLSS